MPIIRPAIALSTRQEAFRRHYATSGNAADAAERAGYSERCDGHGAIYDPWAPEEVEEQRRSRLERAEGRAGEDFGFGDDEDEFAPDHDIA